jgi:hypothetical protein
MYNCAEEAKAQLAHKLRAIVDIYGQQQLVVDARATRSHGRLADKLACQSQIYSLYNCVRPNLDVCLEGERLHYAIKVEIMLENRYLNLKDHLCGPALNKL